MTYEFLNKAQSQPDLVDFCEYIKKPLSILNDINYRYKELQLTKRVEPENLETYYKVDVILEKHLPEMVDNFCNFSFDYRNSKNIDIGDICITPKELLLKNLAKIIEEVQIIETDFNRNNSFHAVVQNKFLNNYGYQSQLGLEKEQVTSNNIQLENKFNYQDFVENNDFKHLKKIELNLSEEQKSITENKQPLAQWINSKLSKMNNFHKLCIGIGTLVCLSVGSYIYYDSQKNDRLISNLSILQAETQKLHKDKNYEKVSMNELLAEAEIGTYNSYTPWNTTIEVKPVKINNSANSFAIQFDSVGKEAKQVCEALSEIVDQLDAVFINELEFRGDEYMTKDKFKKYCHTNNSYYYFDKPNQFRLIYKQDKK
jgi:hypothetical protein